MWKIETNSWVYLKTVFKWCYSHQGFAPISSLTSQSRHLLQRKIKYILCVFAPIRGVQRSPTIFSFLEFVSPKLTKHSLVLKERAHCCMSRCKITRREWPKYVRPPVPATEHCSCVVQTTHTSKLGIMNKFHKTFPCLTRFIRVSNSDCNCLSPQWSQI